jgi:RHH-type proline utilization regulon transcriptional repressor/proline dehydrogenase/delta 1-pyrroline-5-carboxylate dehydrogenase
LLHRLHRRGQAIQRTLAAKDGPIVPLIAETGGLNAMIVDSTALPEQVVDAVVQSAFRSAGQRCSALRLLCLQEDIADGMLKMLAGAIGLLRGRPGRLGHRCRPGDRRRGRRHAAPPDRRLEQRST